jgi:hypothetical protein
MMLLSASLDELVRNLKGNNTSDTEFFNKFKILCELFGENLTRILSRKGVYPYEHMSDWDNFNEKTFPPIEVFFSSLRGESISEKDYLFGKSIFDKYCKDMGDYHDLYMLKDTALLACGWFTWLKKYVLFNANLRSLAQNTLEKYLYKFFVNSIFGKSMEPKRKRDEAVSISDSSRIKFYVGRSNFKSYQIISESVVIVYLSRPKAILDRPIHPAFSVLDLSKLFMYEWHYEKKIKVWYGSDAQFWFTDTDSLAYSIRTEDLYEDLRAFSNEFDLVIMTKVIFFFPTTTKKSSEK